MSPSAIVCGDGHLHLHPVFSLARAFDCLYGNLDRLAERAGRGLEPARVALLADGRNARVFRDLKDDRITLPGGQYTLNPAGEPGCLVVLKDGRMPLYLIAGRQIATRERLEVLALAAEIQEDLDGHSVEETIQAVSQRGAIPVLNWAPGKWFFERGKVVQRLIAANTPNAFLIGDTSLRATLWPVPRLMRVAQDKGFSVIAGSDPLPFAGEEAVMGTYGFTCEGVFDANTPMTSMRRILTENRTRLQIHGQRSSVVQMLARLRKNAAAKQRAEGGRSAGGEMRKQGSG